MKRFGVIFKQVFTTNEGIYWRDCRIVKTHLAAEGVEYTEFETEVGKENDRTSVREIVIAPTRNLIMVRNA